MFTKNIIKWGLPQTLLIPSQNISVPVESVGKDEKDNMDIPSNFLNTAWYNRGPRPGEIGNAVIDGHYDTPTGNPSVFYNIHSLKQGDELVVVDDTSHVHPRGGHQISVEVFP